MAKFDFYQFFVNFSNKPNFDPFLGVWGMENPIQKMWPRLFPTIWRQNGADGG